MKNFVTTKIIKNIKILKSQPAAWIFIRILKDWLI